VVNLPGAILTGAATSLQLALLAAAVLSLSSPDTRSRELVLDAVSDAR
jgi:hypothetical protein